MYRSNARFDALGALSVAEARELRGRTSADAVCLMLNICINQKFVQEDPTVRNPRKPEQNLWARGTASGEVCSGTEKNQGVCRQSMLLRVRSDSEKSRPSVRVPEDVGQKGPKCKYVLNLVQSCTRKIHENTGRHAREITVAVTPARGLPMSCNDASKEAGEVARAGIDTYKRAHKVHMTTQIRKQEELRELVGSRYSDFIEAADTISNMRTSAHQILDTAAILQDLSKKVSSLPQVNLLR